MPGRIATPPPVRPTRRKKSSNIITADTLSLSKDNLDMLKRISEKTGEPIERIIIKGALTYGNIEPRMVVFGRLGEEVEITKDGKMIVDIPASLALTLDIENYFVAFKTVEKMDEEGKVVRKKVKRPREEILMLQAPLIAFLYHLATANELPWYWDHTGWYLAGHIERMGRRVGLPWEDIKQVAEAIVSVVWSLYPHLWGSENASKFASKALSKLLEKYPEFKLTRDTKGECFNGIKDVTVVVEWNGNKECFDFVD